MHSKLAIVLTMTGAAAAGLIAGIMLGRVDLRVHRLLGANTRLLSRADHRLASALVDAGQGHLLKGWPRRGVRDDAKRKLLARADAHVAAAGSALEQERMGVLQPPVAVQKPHVLEKHGDNRVDPYYWLRDDKRQDKEVLEHLQSENAYTRAVMADTESLQEALYKELRGRIQEADQSTPMRHAGYYYYSRTLEGAQYRVHCRRKVPENAGPPSETEQMDKNVAEEVLLDENAEAAKHSFYTVGGFELSPDQLLLAWAEDTVGGETYTLKVKEVATGKMLLKTPIKDTSGSLAWANDNKTLFYVTKDPLDRPYKVWRHGIGSDPAGDVCVYHETDEAFYIGIGRSRSEQMLFIHAGSAVTSDVRFLAADSPSGEWAVVRERQSDVEYSVDHRGDHFFMTLRDAARPNSELLVAPVADPSATTVLVPHREEVKIESVVVSRDFLALFERQQGLQVATVFKLPDGEAMPTKLAKGAKLAFDEPAYELAPGGEGDWDSPLLRLAYTSLTTPMSTLDHNMQTGGRATKKVAPVLGGFSAGDYVTQRLWAKAPDGVKVPVSLVYRKDLAKLDGSDPLLLDGYGSYEICNDPYFSSKRLSLLDRGWTFAIAHVRGGGEMGRRWYEDGKYLKKKNTFTDFIAVAEHLIKEKYTSPAKMAMSGRSAGGLLMGAVTNMRPDLFKAVVMGVPFVDALTTMLDETIPLTVIEWEEWGNPNDPEFYEYMKSYSPVDNVTAQDYPNILVTAGLHDPRVLYSEPAKLVAKLRAHKTDNNLLLFKCEMGAGHFSQSGRFDRLKEDALEFAFLLKVQGMVDVPPTPGSGASKQSEE